MKCSNLQCKNETLNGGLCSRCEANLAAFLKESVGDTYSESEILYFLNTEADGLQDMSSQEARLLDDIREFGDRELKPFELRIGSQMLARYKVLKRRLRP